MTGPRVLSTLLLVLWAVACVPGGWGEEVQVTAATLAERLERNEAELSKHKNQPPRVAVIGAGIGGAMAAHFIKKEFCDGLTVDVFERTDEIGGRAMDVELDGVLVETGASMLHEFNHYFRDLADEMGLTRQQPPGESDGTLWLWDGEKFPFHTYENSWRSTVATAWRYGFTPLYWRMYCKKMFDSFSQIYDLQGNGTSFRTPEEMLRAMHLWQPTQEPLNKYFKYHVGSPWGSRNFLEEMVGAINRCNVNQGVTVNALMGLVNSLPAFYGSIFNIKEGNREVAARAIHGATKGDHHTVKGKVHMKIEIKEIAQVADGQFWMAGDGYGKQNNDFGPYAAVVLATPLEITRDIKFSGFEMPDVPEREFQTTIATFVKGEVDPSYFGVDALSGTILATSSAKTPFSSLSPRAVSKVDNQTIYKVFSEKPLTPEFLEAAFRNGSTVMHEQPWAAYPKFVAPEKFAPFELTPGVYYNNAWENAASAMEMMAIAAKNTALLMTDFLKSSGSFFRRPITSTCATPDEPPSTLKQEL